MGQENQIQKTDSSAKTLVQSLSVAIKNDGNYDIAKIDKMQLSVALKQYKNPNGSINFPKIFDIPVDQRIPALAKNDLPGTIQVIAVAITMAMETINIPRKMNAIQILDLAETIVDTAEEDDVIALEDVMLFLQKLTRGAYPDLYEGIDQIKFMKRFGEYRDERFLEGVKLKEEQHLIYKNMGDRERKGSKMTEFDEHLSAYTTKLQAKNDEIRELRAERKRNQ